MKKVKFNSVNLTNQEISKNEMKAVAGGYDQIWCLCIVSTQWGTHAICVANEDECNGYGSVLNISCDPNATHNGVGC